MILISRDLLKRVPSSKQTNANNNHRHALKPRNTEHALKHAHAEIEGALGVDRASTDRTEEPWTSPSFCG